jgi:hypothetical protein
LWLTYVMTHHLTQIPSRFHENYTYANRNVIKILLFSLFMERSSGTVCSRDYPYDFPTSYLNLVTLSLKIIHQFKFYTEMFSSQFSSRNQVLEFVGSNTITEVLDIIHRPVFYLKTTFRRLDSVSIPRYKAYSVGLRRR